MLKIPSMRITEIAKQLMKNLNLKLLDKAMKKYEQMIGTDDSNSTYNIKHIIRFFQIHLN